MDVNADLYDFLKENETGIFMQNGQLTAYVHVYFSDLDDFIKIIGDHWFDESPLEVNLCKNTVAIDLNDIFESYGHYILSYKNCFEESDINHYKEKLEKELEH
ncbi:hypothetical protein [Priestia megaterium]|uniref:hypothetical protein n=1 Tax=Priestia megaterium TaxID=1404 RepID=UPI003CC61F9C